MNTKRRIVPGLAAMAAFGIATTIVAPACPATAADGDGDAQAGALRQAAQSTGSIITVRNDGSATTYASGSTSSGANDEPTDADKFRVASNTKMYVSTIVLQLVEEGEVDLDESIGTYLPGVVVGDGIDENVITVRNLLQHTSGIADYATPDVVFNPQYQWVPPKPADLIRLGTRRGSQSKPGTAMAYSNTGYVILGELIEKITGQRIGDVIDERIVNPLGLEETMYAYAGEKAIPGPHFSGYIGVPPLLFETSGHEPGLFGSAGALLSSGSDMTVFVDALVGGDLLTEESLAEMETTFKDTGYGLGLFQLKTSCGVAWGHNGHVPGYLSYAIADGDGRSMFAAVNTSPTVADPSQQFADTIDSAMCGSESTGKATLPKAARVEFRRYAER
ncbi:serine hydrolase domain-containing protein [Solicola gregarius]|uniref:Beta-lactamase family protein n=1 Tax=Solicola gregarius TaxID=2908642 RepID=A0AA46TJ43_9ACTN|nr:serine hydrolase domain-containing protein [Solicola gregarius]UYM05438.1 beta-lactamase family protein [Solicola gregarius]